MFLSQEKFHRGVSPGRSTLLKYLKWRSCRNGCLAFFTFIFKLLCKWQLQICNNHVVKLLLLRYLYSLKTNISSLQTDYIAFKSTLSFVHIIQAWDELWKIFYYLGNFLCSNLKEICAYKHLNLLHINER